MFHRLLNFLRCPHCGNRLQISCFLSNQSTQTIANQYKKRCVYCTFNKKFDCNNCYAINIKEGLIYCSCGAVYPVTEDVPRMILDALNEYPHFYFIHKKEIDSKIGKWFTDMIPREIKKTQKSFSQQWLMFDYSSDRTWARTPEQRKDEVLVHFDTKASAFKEKLLLDAGCGNGIESAVITSLGAEVIGFDLSTSIERANKYAIKFRKENSAPLHYVQSDLMKLPFAHSTFDFVSSSGVLHHTPNTKKAFNSIAPLCKKGGMLWIWLYQREKWIAKTIEITKIFTRRFPLRFLYYTCYVMAPFYGLLKSMLNVLKLGNYPSMTFKENVVSLSDTITPEYAFNHTPKEVSLWYKEAGFKNIKVTWKDRCGFGILGIKK